MLKLKRVDPWQYAEVLYAMQLECLPADDPCDVRPNDVWLLGMDGKEPACFAVARPLPGTRMWYLARAGVRDVYQGQGLQRRMIRARVRAAKAAGATAVITDCTAVNAASANNLIACGFRVYRPEYRWALPTSIYWRLKCETS